MRQEKVKQLIKILETEKTDLTINGILYGLKRLKNFVSAGFAMRGDEVFRVHVRGTFAYLDLMATYADSYQVGLVYKEQSFILSEVIINRSSISAFYESTETAVLKAEEFIKSLDEQKDTEAGEAEINAICKAIDTFQKRSKIPVWAKWIAIDAKGTVWVYSRRPEIAPLSEVWVEEGDMCDYPKHIYTLSSMEGIDWRKSCISIDKVLQRIQYNEERVSECEPSYIKERETIETLTERVNKQEEVIIGLLRFMYDKKFLFDRFSDTKSCGALFEKCDEYLKKLGSTPYEYQKKKIVN